ncbi:gliding motility-associated C-terminal domain-containing protein [Kaistella haifensis]|nr:gliding motility-associated C-terminal domain-containing protein [Kaistella haifensis]
MRKIYFLLFILSFVSGFTQSVNIINPADNAASAYPAQQYFCTGESFNLKVDAVATSTGDYTITKDNPSSYPFSAGDTTIKFDAAGSNKFSEAFPIGFTFSFYGKNYTKVVMGSNGRLVFTNDVAIDHLKDTSTYTDRTFSGITSYNSYSKLPSTDYNKVYKTNSLQELNLAQIFFGYTDLVPRSQNSSVTYLYKNVTVGGVKGLIVSFQNQIRTNGTGGISSLSYFSNVLLLEDGRMVIYVNNKTEDSYNAILGIQNDDASKFKVPTHSNAAYDYNNGKWKNEDVAWLFTPSQNLTPKFKWYQNSTLLSETSNTLNNFSPNADDVLKVEVTYHDSLGVQVGPMVSDQVTFKKVITPVIEATLDCSYEMKVSDATYDPALKYTWYKVGNPTPIRVDRIYPIHRNTQDIGDYYVKVTKPDGTPICSSGDESNRLTYDKQRFPGLISTSYTACDNSGLASKTINLYQIYYPKYNPATGREPYIIKFYTRIGGGTGVEVADPENFVLPANTNMHLGFAVLEGSGINACHTGALSIGFLSMPATENISLCASATTFDLKAYFQKPSYPFYSYQYNYADGSTVSDPSAVDVSKQVVVKTTIPGGCSVTTTVSFTRGTATVLPTVPMQERCAGTYNNTNRFDFNAIKAILDETNQFDIKFYFKSNNNEIIPGVDVGDPKKPNLNMDGYFWSATTGDYVVYAKAFNRVDPTCYTVSNDIVLRVYLKPAKSSSADSFLNKIACGISSIDLTINNVFDVINSNTVGQIPSMKYFDASGVELTGTEITNYPISRGIPYLEIQNGVCLPPLKLNYNIVSQPFPLMNPANQTICDDNDGNADGKVSINIAADNFKQKFTSNISNATFKFYDGATLIYTSTNTGDTFNYSVSNNKTITVSVSSATYCPANAKITYFVNTPNSIQFSGNTELCFGDDLSFTIENFSVFSSVKLLSPDGTEIPINSNHTIPYSEVRFGETYTLKAENTLGCASEFTFKPSNSNQPKIGPINQTNNSIEVIASGGATPYLYYFNGVRQTSPILMNPTASSYIVQVESATECLGEPKTIYFIKIHNAFSPNGDGINDTWTIENLDKMESFTIQIVDRYGNKVFESQNKNNVVWDGKSNGRALPTGTYWYHVVWFDALTQKSEQRQGWVLLKNRN